MLLSEFSHKATIISCTRTIICNICEQMNVLVDIFNAGGNVEDQEDYGFTASFFNIASTIIDGIIKKKLIKMQLKNFGFPERYREY